MSFSELQLAQCLHATAGAVCRVLTASISCSISKQCMRGDLDTLNLIRILLWFGVVCLCAPVPGMCVSTGCDVVWLKWWNPESMDWPSVLFAWHAHSAYITGLPTCLDCWVAFRFTFVHNCSVQQSFFWQRAIHARFRVSVGEHGKLVVVHTPTIYSYMP